MTKNRLNFQNLFPIFSLPILILIIHSILSFFGLYRSISWIDIPMHFIGGVLIGRSYFLLMKLFQKLGYLGETHEVLFFILVISMVGLTVVIWEFGEFTLDLIDNGMRQPNLFNTMQDLFLGLTGGILGFFIRK